RRRPPAPAPPRAPQGPPGSPAGPARPDGPNRPRGSSSASRAVLHRRERPRTPRHRGRPPARRGGVYEPNKKRSTRVDLSIGSTRRARRRRPSGRATAPRLRLQLQPAVQGLAHRPAPPLRRLLVELLALDVLRQAFLLAQLLEAPKHLV